MTVRFAAKEGSRAGGVFDFASPVRKLHRNDRPSVELCDLGALSK